MVKKIESFGDWLIFRKELEYEAIDFDDALFEDLRDRSKGRDNEIETQGH
jgi:hypothetical protein